jgi:hypothetical protein
VDLANGQRSPVVIGDSPAAFAIARQAVEAGRHVLIASAAAFPAERLALLYGMRRKNQSLFVWSERRYHPGYHFVQGLAAADAAWRPRYLRQESLTAEPTTSSLVRWQALEATALALTLTPEAPIEVAASEESNPMRHAPDLLSLRLAFPDLDAFINVGMGEAIERRETLVAAADRKAYIDELNPSLPLRLIEDSSASPSTARWLSCQAPSQEEMTRQQCLAFLDATLKPNLAQDEANLWLHAIAVLRAMDRSLQTEGRPAPVEIADEDIGPRFRLIMGRAVPNSPNPAA